MAHLKLGEILIKQGLITEAQLSKAIEIQKKEKGRIGEILIRHGLISEENIVMGQIVLIKEKIKKKYACGRISLNC